MKCKPIAKYYFQQVRVFRKNILEFQNKEKKNPKIYAFITILSYSFIPDIIIQNIIVFRETYLNLVQLYQKL